MWVTAMPVSIRREAWSLEKFLNLLILASLTLSHLHKIKWRHPNYWIWSVHLFWILVIHLYKNKRVTNYSVCKGFKIAIVSTREKYSFFLLMDDVLSQSRTMVETAYTLVHWPTKSSWSHVLQFSEHWDHQAPSQQDVFTQHHGLHSRYNNIDYRTLKFKSNNFKIKVQHAEFSFYILQLLGVQLQDKKFMTNNKYHIMKEKAS